MRNGLNFYFGLRLNKEQKFNDLNYDFKRIFDLYDAASKVIFHDDIFPDSEKRKQYVVEIKNEGVVFGSFIANNGMNVAGNHLSGLVKLIGFNPESKIFEELNDEFNSLVKKYSNFE